MQEDHSVSLINMQAVCLPSYFVLQQLYKLCEVLTVVMHNIVLSCNKQTNKQPPQKKPQQKQNRTIRYIDFSSLKLPNLQLFQLVTPFDLKESTPHNSQVFLMKINLDKL